MLGDDQAIGELAIGEFAQSGGSQVTDVVLSETALTVAEQFVKEASYNRLLTDALFSTPFID